MKSLFRLVLALAVLVLLAAIGGYVWLQSVDAEDYRAEIIDAVEAATGRKLGINGTLAIGSGLAPAVVAQEVRLSDADWAGEGPMASAERVEIVVQVLPLLVGELVIDRVVLDGARLRLQRNAEGEANWEFASEDSASGDAPLIAGLVMRDAEISYRNAATGAELALGVDELEIGAAGLFEALDIVFDGTWNEVPLTVIGEVGPIEAVFAGGALEVDLELSSGEMRLRVAGDIEDPAGFAGLDLALDAEGGDLALVNRFHPLDLPETRSFAGTARLRDGQGVYRFEDIDAAARIEDLELSGTGSVADIDTFRDFSLQAHIEGGDLAALGRAIDVDLPATDTLDATGRFYRAAGRYGIEGLRGNAAGPDATVELSGDIGDLETISRLDLEVAGAGGDLGTLGAALGEIWPQTESFDIAGRVRDSAEGRRIDELVALLRLEQAELSVEGRIGNLDRFASVDLQARASGPDLVSALNAFGVDGGSAMPFDLDLRLSDNGAGGWVAEKLNFTAGESRITGLLTMEPGNVPAIAGELESPVLDLDALLGRDPEHVATAPFETEEGRVFSETPLPFVALRLVDLDIGLAIGELRAGAHIYRDLAAGVTLSRGKLAVEDLQARLDEGRVVANMRIDAARDEPRMEFELRGEDVDVPAVLRALGINSALKGNRGAVSLDLAGSGYSPAALAASLEGESSIVLGPGRLRNWTTSLLTADFLRLLSGNTGDGVDVDCVVAGFGIEGGIAKNRTVLIQTEGARLAPVGTIDFGRERYDLVLYSRSRVPSLSSLAVPLRITGPLDDPSAFPDPAIGTIDTIGNLLSLATLGLSRGIFGDAVPAGCASAGGPAGTRDPEDVVDRTADAVGDAAEDTADAVGRAVDDTVRGVGRAIDRIFGN